MPDRAPTRAWLFTDVEGSTRLWQAHPEAMPDAYRIHDHTLRAAIETWDGVVAAIVGDAFQAAFPSVEQAVRAAIDAQRRLQAETWPLPERLRVRMAIHVPPPGQAVVELAIMHELGRVLGTAHGEQIIATKVAVSQAEDTSGAWWWVALGDHQIEGLAAGVSLHQVSAEGLRSHFPPPRSRSTHPHNLPVLASETGRDPEVISEVRDHFDRGTRVVTLVAGDLKHARETSVACAWNALPRFPDGAYQVEVAGSIPRGVLSSLDGETNPDPTREELMARIGSRQILLVVSGLETTTDGVTELAEALARCLGLHVVVAAREPLRIRWERVVYLRDS